MYQCDASVTQKWGVGKLQGTGKRYHPEGSEDRALLAPSFSNSGSLFAIFDGHGGFQVSDYAHKHFNDFLFNSYFNGKPVINEKTIPSILEEALVKFDIQIFKNVKSEAGCTACVVYIQKNKVFCANLGDSRAVLYTNNKVIPLSYDQKPKEEAARIKEAGGFIFGGRVNGVLAVARGLGDFGLKNFTNENINTLDAANMKHPVSNRAEVIEQSLGDKDSFVVVASDGLWDVLGNVDAIDIIKKDLAQKKDLQTTAQHLVEVARAQGSDDDITAIVIKIN